MLWRGSRNTAYVVDCCSNRLDLSIVPFWASLSEYKAVELPPQQKVGILNIMLCGRISKN
jgi:hypothetical protein